MPAHLRSALFYRDPRAALAWLEKAFGFELSMLLETAEGDIAHSQMTYGDGVIMVGTEWSEAHRSPASVEGRNTQTVNIELGEGEDVNAHCERARAAGAVILAEPETQFYGDRTYRCSDLEGHMWTISQTVQAVSREEAEAATGLKITGWR